MDLKEVLSKFWYKVHQIPKLKCFSTHFTFVFAQSIEAWCSVENEDVVGPAPAGDAPTTFEWSTTLLPTKVWLILEVWQCLYINHFKSYNRTYPVDWTFHEMNIKELVL